MATAQHVASPSPARKGNPCPARLAQAYTPGRLLGSGSFSVVVAARPSPNCNSNVQPPSDEVAVKIITKKNLLTQEERQFPKREISAYNRLGSHPNLLRMIECFEDEENHFIVMEAGGPSVHSLLTKAPLGMDEQTAKRVTAGLLQAVEHVHAMGMIHGDIAPKNVLVHASNASANDVIVEDAEQVKLCDFGLTCDTKKSADNLPSLETPSGSSCSLDSSSCLSPVLGKATVRGTIGYVAPEIMAGEEVSEASDIYSVGAMCYELLTGMRHVPLTKPSDTISFQDAAWEQRSDSAKDFVAKLLALDPDERPSASDARNHEWFRNEA